MLQQHLPVSIADVTEYTTHLQLANRATRPISHPMRGDAQATPEISPVLTWEAMHWFDSITEDGLTIIAESISTGSCEALSDGSYNPNPKTGTAAWCISHDPNIRSTISAGLTVPSSFGSHSSYRSELSGVYCIVKVLHWIIINRKLGSG